MYAQREKPKEKKKQVTVVVNQTKTSPRLGEDCLAHRPNGLGQRHDKAQIRNAATRYCQPSPSTIQRMDDDKDKDKDKDKEQTSENLDNLQLSLELLGMTPGVGMIADAANVGISLFRGNYADALINLAAMVPLVGQGVTGGKLATKAASSATDVLGATKAKTANNLVDDAMDLSKTTGAKNTITAAPKRPTWRQSEIDVTAPLKLQGFKSQLSFKNNVEVPYGTKGSTRPEAYKEGISIEVKNYNVETSKGRSNLIRNVSKQAKHRALNLPADTIQQVNIDVRGQKVTRTQLHKIVENMVKKSNGILKAEHINILR